MKADMDGKENKQERKLIDLIGYPALLINKHGVVIAINKYFENNFLCNTNSCHCNRSDKSEKGICYYFFMSMMELVLGFPHTHYADFYQNNKKWFLHCKVFDQDQFLIYATDDIDPIHLNKKLKILKQKSSNIETANLFNLSPERNNVLEISLSEFEKSLNKSFLLIQNSCILYINEIFRKEFEIWNDNPDIGILEKIFGRPLQFFITLCNAEYNHTPIEIDAPYENSNKYYKIQGKEVIFNQSPAYALVLDVFEKPIQKAKKTIQPNATPMQKINWETTNIDLKVLIVEDKQINQKILKIMLENIGCNVDLANNGQEGLDMIKNNHYDIIFMDIQMPIMDGLTASRKLLEISDPPPVIAVTANFEFLETLDLNEYGIKDYIAKPVRTEELYEKLLYWVQ
jgi:CheY-like chemotaxis protein